jgi:DNA-binding CsgD family transcriptional regulator
MQLEYGRAVTEALALIGLAAAVLRESGEVIAANDLFAALMPFYSRDASGRPRLADPVADRLLGDALSRLDSSTRNTSHAVSIRGEDGTPTAVVNLLPLRGAARDAMPGINCIFIVTSVRRIEPPSAAVLQSLFGLSPAEARVARGIASGRTLGAIAGDMGRSRETVRCQLKTVLAKTGTRRQLDLAVLLSGLHFPKS